MAGPVQQLLGDRVPVVVGQQVDPLLPQPQVSQQPLHDGGLLEDGVAMGPLQKQGEGPSEGLSQQEPTDPRINTPEKGCGNVEYGKQQLGCPGMSMGAPKGSR